VSQFWDEIVVEESSVGDLVLITVLADYNGPWTDAGLTAWTNVPPRNPLGQVNYRKGDRVIIQEFAGEFYCEGIVRKLKGHADGEFFLGVEPDYDTIIYAEGTIIYAEGLLLGSNGKL
jgi:hypothetical protein